MPGSLEVRKRNAAQAFKVKRAQANDAAFSNLRALGRGTASIPGRVFDYFKNSTAKQVNNDLGSFARSTFKAMGDNPNKFIEDSIAPFSSAFRDFGDVRATARKLRAQGLNAEADKMEAMAGAAALGAIPVVGRIPGTAARTAIKAGEKAAIKAGEKAAIKAGEKAVAKGAVKAAEKKVAPFTATPPQVEPLPGKGGKSRRKSTPEQVVSQASTRVRQEARARNQVKDPAERRAIRETYTVGPLKIDPDPELERFKIEPGNAQSVTSQAAEQGFPVVGMKPFSAQHPAGYSTSYGADKPDPLNFTAEYRNRTPEPDLPELTEADFPIGSGLYRMLGDATMANKDVISVDGVRLRSPVSTYGGAGYGAQERAIGSPLVWASDAGFTENDARMIQDFYNANPGDPLFGLHVNMGPSGSDFSHQGSSVLAKMIPEMGYSGDTLRAIDDYIRSGAQGLPDFQGFAENPDLGMFDLLTRTGADRKLVVKRLSDVNQKAQAAGVPKDLGALARLAVSEQGLRLAPQGSTGFSVAQIDPSNFFRVDPELLSKTKRDLFENTDEYANVLGEPVNMRVDYNSGLSGTVKGQMENLIPAEIPFNPVFERAKKFDKNNNPTTSTMKFKSFATDPNSIVKVTPEIRDAIGEYLYRTKRFKKLGFACGGPVKKRRFATK
jgi:hypothetical protein